MDNDSLPEKDQLDRKLFELDVDEQSRQISEGEDKVADLKMDLKAWTLARQQVSIKIKKEVWDKMEVSGRSLTGIVSETSVNNFPMQVIQSLLPPLYCVIKCGWYKVSFLFFYHLFSP